MIARGSRSAGVAALLLLAGSLAAQQPQPATRPLQLPPLNLGDRPPDLPPLGVDSDPVNGIAPPDPRVEDALRSRTEELALEDREARKKLDRGGKESEWKRPAQVAVMVIPALLILVAGALWLHRRRHR